jgi:hypothetical protein
MRGALLVWMEGVFTALDGPTDGKAALLWLAAREVGALPSSIAAQLCKGNKDIKNSLYHLGPGAIRIRTAPSSTKRLPAIAAIKTSSSKERLAKD